MFQPSRARLRPGPTPAASLHPAIARGAPNRLGLVPSQKDDRNAVSILPARIGDPVIRSIGKHDANTNIYSGEVCSQVMRDATL